MEAQLVALNDKEEIVETHVLDMPWKSVLLAMIPFQKRKECQMWDEKRLQEMLGVIFLNMDTAVKIAIAKVQESPMETKWTRMQKIEALKWLSKAFDGSRSWEDLCVDASRRFKINSRDFYEEYAWFLACLGLKQLIDFMFKWKDCVRVIAPVAPLENE